MNIREEPITRKHVEEARQRGQLVDLSEEANQAGLLCRCEMSGQLYGSLFWKYPSSREQDTLDVGEVLNVLQSRLESSRRPREAYCYTRPPQPTWWLHQHYFLKTLVLYQDDVVDSIVILSFFDTQKSLLSCLPPSMPASLLVRLIQSVRRLWSLCYRSERPLVRSLDVTMTELLQRSPLYAEIYNYLDELHSSSVHSGFSREECREVTLRSLLEQLELTAAVAEKLGADIRLPVSSVLQLMANYVGIVPVNEDGILLGDKVQFH